MKTWFAGEPGGHRKETTKDLSRLLTFFLREREQKKEFKMIPKNKVDLFLDSGAFSAFTQKVEIDIEEYIAFIKEHKKYLTVYANLDVIGSARGTWENQQIMERAGLNPLPCFHYGENIKWLKRYLDRGYDYIALGGMVPISSRDLTIWLDDLFTNYLTGPDGLPLVKVHGFGLTSLPLMLRYPWYSVDSTSWVVTGRMGSVYIPKMKKGEYVYDENCWKVCISSRSPNVKDVGQHISTFSPKVKQVMLDYIHEKGYQLGLSDFKTVKEDYELKDNEKWFGKAVAGKREVEIIKEPGLCNDYRLRDELNIIYFLDLEEQIQEWPWPFQKKEVYGFDLL